MLQNERSLQKWGLFCCLRIDAAFLQQAASGAIVDGAIHRIP
nr:hypothetical protein [Stenotrophomonas pavanii]